MTGLEQEQIKIRVFNMRRNGASYKKIGEELNMTQAQVHRIFKANLDSLKNYRLDLGKGIIDSELALLDDLIASFLPLAKEGDHKACENVLKTLARRSKYLGLDEAQSVDLSGSVALGEAILAGFREPKKPENAD